jgi:hypothetical protein
MAMVIHPSAAALSRHAARATKRKAAKAARLNDHTPPSLRRAVIGQRSGRF